MQYDARSSGQFNVEESRDLYTNHECDQIVLSEEKDDLYANYMCCDTISSKYYPDTTVIEYKLLRKARVVLD